MRQILFGVVCLLAGIAATYVLLDGPAATNPGREATAAAARDGAEIPRSATAEPAATRPVDVTPPAKRAESVANPPIDSTGVNSGLGDASRSSVDSAAAGGQGTDGASTRSADATAGNGPRQTPIPLANGVELEGNMAFLHALLEHQPDDFAWSDVTEGQLGQYFAAIEDLGRNFGLPTVACRQTICEIQAIGYGSGAIQSWQQLTATMDEQPWAQQFVEALMSTHRLGADVHAVVVMLTVHPDDATLPAPRR